MLGQSGLIGELKEGVQQVINNNFQRIYNLLNSPAPSVKAYISGNQAMANSAWDRIDFDATAWDTTGEFASSVFTCSVPGRYLVAASLLFTNNSTGTARALALYKNNGEAAQMSVPPPGGNSNILNLVTILDLSRADYIDARTYQNISSGTLNATAGERYTNIAIHKLPDRA